MSLTVRKSAARFVPVVAAAALLIAGCSDNSGRASTILPKQPASQHSRRFLRVSMLPTSSFSKGCTRITRRHWTWPEWSTVEPTMPNFSLAAQIEAAQGPEMAQMTELLTKWGRPDPSSSSMEGMDDSAHAGHGVGMAEMPGMMSADDMTASPTPVARSSTSCG